MAKTNNPKKTKDTGAMDIANVGKTANTGSRPIIITNRPMVADPMVVKGKKKPEKNTAAEKASGDAPEKTPQTSKLTSSPRKELVISPAQKSEEAPKTGEVITPEKAKDTAPILESTDDANKTAAIEEAEKAVDDAVKADESAPVEDTKKEQSDTETSDSEAETKPEPENDDSASLEPDENPDSDSGIVDELAKQAASKKQQQAEDKADLIQREKTDELIAAKTYFVPTTQVAKRRVKNVLITFILLALIGAMALNFAIDAELIDIGISPVTDLM